MRDKNSRQKAEFINREKCIQYIMEVGPSEALKFMGTLLEPIEQENFHAQTFEDLSDQQIITIYRSIKADEAAERRRNYDQLEPYLFFNQPSADADFAYWLDIEVWTSDEAAALSMGKEPSVVNALTMRGPLRSSNTRLAYRNRSDAIISAARSGSLSNPIKPQSFIEWAMAKKWDMPERLTEFAVVPTYQVLRARNEELEKANKNLQLETNKLSKQSVDEMDPRSKRSYLKVILGMAIARYEHKVDRNSQGPANIARDIVDLDYENLVVSAETISKMLRNAADEIDITSNRVFTPKWHAIRK